MKNDLSFENDDFLGRREFAENLLMIIQKCDEIPGSNDNDSFVIGLDAAWGSGKTSFIHMFSDYVKGMGTAKIETIYYDAWKCDFWSNAFEPFFDAITQAEIEESSEGGKETVLGKVRAELITVLPSVVNIISYGVQGAFTNWLSEWVGDNGAEKIYEEYQKIVGASEQAKPKFMEGYSAFKEAIEILQASLNRSLANSGGQLIVFVDELDRCKPTFAVQTLEIIKHLFNVRGIVFVLALDIKQLSQCVRAVYGEDIDPVGYLQRFFNYITSLPKINHSMVTDHYIEEYGIDCGNADVRSRMSEIADIFHLSLRDFRTVISNFRILQWTGFRHYLDYENAIILYFYFLSMKYKRSEIYKEAVYEGKYEKLKSFLEEHPIPFTDSSHVETDIWLNNLCSGTELKNQRFCLVSCSLAENEQVCIICRTDQAAEVVDASDRSVRRPVYAGDSLSYLLYEYDLRENAGQLHLPMMEYIARVLEPCEFLENALKEQEMTV